MNKHFQFDCKNDLQKNENNAKITQQITDLDSQNVQFSISFQQDRLKTQLKYQLPAQKKSRKYDFF